jgi:FO synthase
MRVQAPPNLVDLEECRALLAAGVDDWGGVSPLTPDHVNPERPWPSVERLRGITAECGLELRARLTVHPEYVVRGEPWLDPRISAHVAALATEDGLARPGVRPTRLPWQEPDGGFANVGRTDLHAAVDTEGRTEDRRSDFSEVYGDWAELRERIVRDVSAADTPAGRTKGLALSGREALRRPNGTRATFPTSTR